MAGNEGNGKSLWRGSHVKEIQIHLISPWTYFFCPGFIPVFLWKIPSLIECVFWAEQEVGCNGNSFTQSRAAPGKSGCLKYSQQVYREERLSLRDHSITALWDAQIYAVHELACGMVQVTGEGIDVLDQFDHCCDSCAWLGALEKSSPGFFNRDTSMCT